MPEAGGALRIESVTAALDEIGFGRFQWLLLCFTGLAWLADACEVMLLSFLGPAVRCAWNLSPAAESVLSSVVFAGMLAGVGSLGALADVLGRRRGFFLSALLLGIAGLASAFAPSFKWLLVCRCVVGFALGGTPIAVTLFAEFVPSAGRGAWLLLMQGFWTIGSMMEALLAWAVLPHLGWRWLLGLSATPLLLLLLLYPWLPESPHWLLAHGRYAEAEAVILRVAATNRYSQPLSVRLDPDKAELHSGDSSLRQQQQQEGQQPGVAAVGRQGGSLRSRSPQHGDHPPASPPLSAPLLPAASGSGCSSSQVPQPRHGSGRVLIIVEEDGGGGTEGSAPLKAGLGSVPRRARALLRRAVALVFSPQLRRTTLLMYAIWFANAITYYGLVLLTTALQTSSKPSGAECGPHGPNLTSSDYAAILVTTMAEAPGLLAAALLIDRKGRKWTLRAGLMCCGIALLLLIPAPGYANQLLLLFLARGCIEGTFSVLYVFTPELYPTVVRSIGLAMCNGFSRIGGFLAPFATVFLVQQQRPAAAELLLGTLCLGAAACAFALPYETRGRDLQSTHLQPDGGGWAAPGAATSSAGVGGSAHQQQEQQQQPWPREGQAGGQGMHDPEAAAELVPPGVHAAPLLPGAQTKGQPRTSL